MNFLFRSRLSTSDQEDLYQRVIAAGTELAVHGCIQEIHPLGSSSACDREGALVIMDVSAPPGWHHHVQNILDKHGVLCRDYV